MEAESKVLETEQGVDDIRIHGTSGALALNIALLCPVLRVGMLKASAQETCLDRHWPSGLEMSTGPAY